MAGNTNGKKTMAFIIVPMLFPPSAVKSLFIPKETTVNIAAIKIAVIA